MSKMSGVVGRMIEEGDDVLCKAKCVVNNKGHFGIRGVTACKSIDPDW